MTFDFATATGLGATAGTGGILSAYGVALDSAGDTYVTGGLTGSARLDPNSATLTTSHGGRDIFVAKYSPAGALLWSHETGSSGDDTAYAIAVDPSGNAYVTGEFTGQVNFSTNGTPLNLSASNRGDVFVWKLDNGGNTSYAVQTTGQTGLLDTGYAIAVDSSGNAYVGGSYQSTGNLGITLGSTTLADAATFAPFVTKLDSGGNFAWARSAIGAANATNEGKGIAVDAGGNVYLAGDYSGSANFNAQGSAVHTSAGNLDAFVQEFNNAGTFVKAQTFGGPNNDIANGIKVDASGGIFVFGQYSGTANFNPNPGTPVDLTSQGFSGYFVSKLTSAGNLAFADDLGAPLSNVQTNPGAGGLALDSFGNAYVTGIYQGTAHVGTYTFPAAGGVNNSFVTQVSNAGKILQAKRLANSGNVDGQAIAVNASGTIAVAGIYDTAPTFGSHSLPAAVSGNTDMFVTTLTRRTPGDYFGDGKTDLAIYTTSNAYLSAAEPGVHGLYQQFGVAGQDSVPIAGDYDGDGKTDIAIYNRTTATFSILFSGGGGLVQQFGTVGHDNVPVAGDFNGDGKTDLAIFDRTNGFFSILFSGGGGGIFQQFGIGNHDTIPIAGDFDGDGKTDLAIYDRTNSILSVLYSSGTGGVFQQFGIAGHDSVPIAADFDGDGKTDLAIYDRTNDFLSSLYSSGGGIFQQFGSTGHDNVPMAGDYDGDGRTDISIYDRTTATYSILYSSGGGIVQPFGDVSQGTGNRPSPTSYDPTLSGTPHAIRAALVAVDPVLIAAMPATTDPLLKPAKKSS